MILYSGMKKQAAYSLSKHEKLVVEDHQEHTGLEKSTEMDHYIAFNFHFFSFIYRLNLFSS